MFGLKLWTNFFTQRSKNYWPLVNAYWEEKEKRGEQVGVSECVTENRKNVTSFFAGEKCGKLLTGIG